MQQGYAGLLDRRDPVSLPRERAAHRQAHPGAARRVDRAADAARHRPPARPRLAVHAGCVAARCDLPAVLPDERTAVRQAAADLGADRDRSHARAQHLAALPAAREPAQFAAAERPVSLPGAGHALPDVRRRRDLPDLRGVRLDAPADGLRDRGRGGSARDPGSRRSSASSSSANGTIAARYRPSTATSMR